MTRNVTITLPVDDLRWAKVEAAKRDQSVTRFLGDLIREKRAAADNYWRAYEEFRRIGPVPGVDASQRMTRDEAHERR